MNLLAPLSLLLALAGWALTAMTGINLLSGHFDDRTCQTDCVQQVFFSGVAVGLIALVIGIAALRKPRGRFLSVVALLAALGLCAVFATLFVAGNYV